MNEGRSSNFTSGAYSTRFSSRQVGVKPGYRPASVFDSIANSGNGYSKADQSRILLGGDMLRSPNGVAEETWKRKSMLDSPYRPIA